MDNMDEQTGNQMPFMNYDEVIEVAKKGGRESINSLVKFEKGDIDDCDAVDNEATIDASESMKAEISSETKTLDEKLQTAYEKYLNSGNASANQNECRVTEEQIERLCKQNIVTTVIIQRHLSIGYDKAARIADDWTNKGYIIKNNNVRDVVDKEAIRKYLMEMFAIK